MKVLIIAFIVVINRKKIEIRTYEDCIIGVTECCGTGSCASVLAAHRLGLVDDQVEVINPGGTLEVEYDSVADELYLIGEARLVFKANYYPTKNTTNYIK